MPNHIIHFEIGSRDLNAGSQFYAALFDWEFEAEGDIVNIKTGGEIDGHIGSLDHKPSNYTILYVSVDAIQTSIDVAKKNSGKLLLGPTPVSGGQFAWICDPAGNTVGLFQSET